MGGGGAGARATPGLQLLADLRGVRSAVLPTGTPNSDTTKARQRPRLRFACRGSGLRPRERRGLCGRPRTAHSTDVLLTERREFGVGRVWFFDIQGWITLILGGLLALITLFTSYSHVHLPFLGAIALNQQIGVLRLLALVPALVGDAELATRCRL